MPHEFRTRGLSTRRIFIERAAASLVATASFRPGLARSAAEYRNGARITSMRVRDETILRHPSMNGDNWYMTWARDDDQYVGLCDGYGASEWPPGMYNSRLMAVAGGPKGAKFRDVPGYPELITPFSANQPRYYNFGVIAVDGSMYQLLSTWSVPLTSNSAGNGLRFIGVKLIYSRDNGRTWHNQNGSSPVVWEGWANRSKETMLFYEESQDAFSIPSILQMGRDYSDNRDGYVYVYSPNGSTEGTMNQLVMLRVAKDQILDRQAYEYFAGMSSTGHPRWERDIDRRAIVCNFPAGWTNASVHPWAWIPSITYNAPLGIYMMANWATAPGPPPDRKWFTRPSYLGFWIAQHPWGPWTQVYENTSWAPAGDLGARCYSAVIAPKWISDDGLSFWLVWTDYQVKLDDDVLARRWRELKHLSKEQQVRAAAELDRLNRPYYSFNIQRVDIETA